jgi:hypothetical protein
MYDRILDSLVQRIKDYTTSKRFLRTRIAIGQPWEGEPRVLIEFHDPEKNLKSEQLMSIVDVYASSLKQALPVYVKEVEDLSHYQRQYKFFMHLRDAEEGEVKIAEQHRFTDVRFCVETEDGTIFSDYLLNKENEKIETLDMETYINGVLKGLESFEAGDDVFAIPVNGSIKEIDREKIISINLEHKHD